MKLRARINRLYRDYQACKEVALEKTGGSEYKEKISKYAYYYENLKTDKNMILYESYWGRGMTDNPYALFRYMLDREEYKAYKHVWVLENIDANKPITSKYLHYSNVEFVELGSDQYFRRLAQAKYLINNVTFPTYFTKKTNQIYVNTWHGTPLKKMGFDMPNGRTESYNMIRNFLMADYMIAANPTMTKMYLDSYRLRGIMPGKIIEEGYPRNDLLFDRDNREEIIHQIKQFGVEIDSKKKIILYAPTWRGTNGKAVVNGQELLDARAELEAGIDLDEYQVLIKPHQLVYQKLKDDERYRSALIPSFLDANEILSITDILISDYSSIFLDYLSTDRPVLFYMPDLEEYKKERGVDDSIDQMPGPCRGKLSDIAELVEGIEDVKAQYAETYQAYKKRITGLDDGHVTERVANIIFGKGNGNVISEKPHKKKMLISAGHILENGITHSFLSLMKQIDFSEWDVTAFVAEGNNSERIKDIINNEIDSRVRVVVRGGTFNVTYREEIQRNLTLKHGCYHPLYKKLYVEKAYQREWRRCFGDAEFDYIVDFNGYTVLFTPVLLSGNAQRHSIWLHNDIQADMNRTVKGEKPLKEKLNFIISLYPRFDNLVSCGRAVNEINLAKLGKPETKDKFKYAKNTLNIERITSQLSHESVITIDGKDYLVEGNYTLEDTGKFIKAIELPRQDEITFVTMGRMSTEKNHRALIDAFSQFVKTYEKSRLYIIGDGPLRKDIEKQIRKLKLENKITLTGNIANPFSIMKRASCFVMPSKHEGQPMVLLEARSCGLPIIVSNFSTVGDSLYPDGQLLIETDSKSIFEGLCAFAENRVPSYNFSPDQYNQEAYNEFINAIQ